MEAPAGGWDARRCRALRPPGKLPVGHRTARSQTTDEIMDKIMDLGYPLPSDPNAPEPGAAFGAEAVARVKRALMAWPGDHGKPSPDVPGTGSVGRCLGILSCQGVALSETVYGGRRSEAPLHWDALADPQWIAVSHLAGGHSDRSAVCGSRDPDGPAAGVGPRRLPLPGCPSFAAAARR